MIDNVVVHAENFEGSVDFRIVFQPRRIELLRTSRLSTPESLSVCATQCSTRKHYPNSPASDCLIVQQSIITSWKARRIAHLVL